MAGLTGAPVEAFETKVHCHVSHAVRIEKSLRLKSPENAISTILYTEEEYRARSRGVPISMEGVPLPSTDLESDD
jgi:hypothetical protein